MLTEKERIMVDENHKLIYSYAIERNLDLEEYSGLLSIGLCNAAKKYNNEKAVFSTFAYKCMDTEVSKYKRESTTQKRIPKENIYSYDDCSIDDRSFLEEFSTTDDHVEQTIIFLDVFNTEFSKLKDKAKKIVILKYKGFSNNEIANILCMKPSTVSMSLKKFRNMLES